MKRLILSLLMAFVLFAVLLIATAQVGLAAKWHLSNQINWTVGRACRDGVIVVMYGTGPFNLTANPYNANFASYPVLMDDNPNTSYPDISSTRLGGEVGSFSATAPREAPPLLYDQEGRTEIISYHPLVGILKWSNQTPGTTMAVVSSAATRLFMMVKTEDCYLASTTIPKSPSLLFKTTVGGSPNLCSKQTEIILGTGSQTAAYACLIVDNPGDVIFEQQIVTDTTVTGGSASSLTMSFPLTIPPGSLISVTQSIAQEAGIPLILGPLSSGIHTFTWQAKGGAFAVSGQASIKVTSLLTPSPTATPTHTPTPTSFATQTATPTRTATPLAPQTATPTPTVTGSVDFVPKSTPAPEAANQLFLPLVSK